LNWTQKPSIQNLIESLSIFLPYFLFFFFTLPPFCDGIAMEILSSLIAPVSTFARAVSDSSSRRAQKWQVAGNRSGNSATGIRRGRGRGRRGRRRRRRRRLSAAIGLAAPTNDQAGELKEPSSRQTLSYSSHLGPVASLD